MRSFTLEVIILFHYSYFLWEFCSVMWRGFFPYDVYVAEKSRNIYLNRKTVCQLFAGGRDSFRSSKLKIPQFVLHPLNSREISKKIFVKSWSQTVITLSFINGKQFLLHLLLNLWGNFSLMEWKRWAIEASCSHWPKQNVTHRSDPSHSSERCEYFW